MAIYNNVPIYIGGANLSGDSIGDGSGQFLYASKCDVDHSVPIGDFRRLGEDCISSERGIQPSGPDKCELNFSFFLLNSSDNDSVYNFLFDSLTGVGGSEIGNATGENFFPIKVGGQIYNRCFLDNINLKINPFAPISIDAKFTSLDFPTEVDFVQDNETINDYYSDLLNANNVVHSYSCEIVGVSGKIINDSLISSFEFNKDYDRELIRKLGSCKDGRVVVDKVDLKGSIESTGFKSFMEYGGSKIDADIIFTPKDVTGGYVSQNLNFTIPSGTRITNQRYNVDGGGHIVGRVDFYDSI